jgi:hypothetical protein
VKNEETGTSRYEELCGRSEASAWIKNRQELHLAEQRATLAVEDLDPKLYRAEAQAEELNFFATIRPGWRVIDNEPIRRQYYDSACCDRTAGPAESGSQKSCAGTA